MGGAGASELLTWIAPHLRLKAEQVELALLWYHHRPSRAGDPANGRHPARTVEDRALSERLSALLRGMKRGEADAADLVEVRNTLRQIVNVKGD